MNEDLHALRSLDGIADEFVGFFIELAAITFGQQLGVSRHHSQRLLQVMRRDVGELLKIGIGAGQFLHFPGQIGFRLIAQVMLVFFPQSAADHLG